MITERRLSRMKEVIANRQNMTIILENVHDPHNIGAVMRTADSVGIQEIYVLYTDSRLTEDHYLIGKNSASSATKWVDVHYFDDLENCIHRVKEKYDLIYATHLGAEAKSIYKLDFSKSIALMFGNEKDGLSAEALKHADANMLIPQYGMIKSLNISVACAVTLYEALRQRESLNMYGKPFDESLSGQEDLLNKYKEKKKSLN